MNAPANISYEDRLKAQYAAAKARTFPAKSMQRQRHKNALASFYEPKKRTQQKPPTKHDAHMHARMVWKAWTGAPMLPKEYFTAACWLAGYTPEIIRSPSRSRPVVTARKAIIRSLAQRFPTMSSPKIGEIINREYTTVLYAMGQIRRSEKQKATPIRKRNNEPQKYKHVNRIIRLRLEGHAFDDIARMLNTTKEECWKAMDRHRKRLKARSKGRGTISEHRAVKDGERIAA